jgi:hypothetical protein
MAKQNTQQAEDGEIQEPRDDEEPAVAEKPPKPEVDNDDETGGVVVREHVRRPRKERREEHQNDEVARLRRENEDIRRQFDTHRQQTDLTLQQLRQGTQQIQQRDADPTTARLRAIRSQQEMIQTQVRNSQDAAEVERLKQQFYQLGEEYDEVRETRLLTRAEEIARRQAAQAAQSGQGEEAILRAEFPDLIPVNPQQMTADQAKVLRYAAGEYQRLTAKGEPQTIATSRKALVTAAQEFGMRQAAAPAPSLTQQQRFGSLPIQAGVQSTRNETRLNKSQMRMATARWPEVPVEEAYANMARALADLDRREKNGGNDEIGG